MFDWFPPWIISFSSKSHLFYLFKVDHKLKAVGGDLHWSLDLVVFNSWEQKITVREEAKLSLRKAKLYRVPFFLF